jgi:hypothetical protein
VLQPIEVIFIETEQGRAILGVVDGFKPKGIETEKDVEERKHFLRKIDIRCNAYFDSDSVCSTNRIESFIDSLLHILTDIWDLCHVMCSPPRRPFVHSVPDLHSRHCYFHVYSLDLIRLVEIKYLSCLKLHLYILGDIHHNTVGDFSYYKRWGFCNIHLYVLVKPFTIMRMLLHGFFCLGRIN